MVLKKPRWRWGTVHRTWMAGFLLLLFAGCASPAPLEGDAPGEETPAAGDGPAPSAPDPGPDAPSASPSGQEVEAVAGTLWFEQDAAVICPLYFEGPGHSNAVALELEDAVAFDVVFEWTPVVDAFRGAILGLDSAGTQVGGDGVSVRGASGLRWQMGAEALAGAREAGADLLHIVGPACLEEQESLQTGVAYRQEMQFRGNITYERSAAALT